MCLSFLKSLMFELIDVFDRVLGPPCVPSGKVVDFLGEPQYTEESPGWLSFATIRVHIIYMF